MKRLSLFLVCLLATAGMVRAGLPLKAYTLQKTPDVTLHTFSADATTISYIKSGDTLGIANYSSFVFLGENALEKQNKVSGNFPPVTDGLREIGFSFPIEDSTFTKFGIGGNGLIYFGNESLSVGHVESNLSGNDWKGSNFFGTYLMTETATGLNRVYDDDNTEHKVLPALILAGADTKIQYETKDNVLYIGFEKLHVLDKDGNDRLTATYQYQVEPNGTISLLVGDIVPQEEKSYFLRTVFVSTSTMQCLNFKNDELSYNGQPSITLGSASSQYANTKYSMVPPEPCSAIQEYSLNWKDKITAAPGTISFAYNFYDTEKATNLLMVLTDSENPVKGELNDQTTYQNGGKLGEFPIRIASMGNASAFTGLTANTTYWLHVFPYNTNCADGPIYGMEILKPVTTALASLNGISVTSINEDTIDLSVSAGSFKYILGVSNTKIYDFRANPISEILKDSTPHEIGEVIEFRYAESGVSVSADIKILAVNATDATFRMTGAELGTDYFFYAWGMEGAGENVRYSFDYVEACGRTATQAPAVLDFTDKEMIRTPAGWETSMVDGYRNFETTTYSKTWDAPVYACQQFYTEATTGTASVWAVSPWFKGSGALQAVFNVTFYTLSYSALDGSTPVFSKSVNASDSVVFQIQEKGGSDWTTIGRVNSETPWTAGFNEIVTETFTPAKEFRFRMVFYQDAKTASGSSTGRYFALKSLGVEKGSSCLYPVGITAPEDSMGYGSAKLMWTDPNEIQNNSYVVKYRMASDNNGWITERTSEQQIVLTGLRSGTDYVASVQTVCSADDMSTVKEISFTTARNIVYEQNNFEADNLSDLGYLSLKGAPGGLNALSGEDLGWFIIEDETAPGAPSVASLDRNMAQVTNRWLITPVLYSGFDGKVKLTAGMSAWLNEAASGSEKERKAATGISNDTLFIYRSANRNFTAQSEIVGKVVLDDLTPQYRNLEFEFEVKAAEPNMFAFYFHKINDYNNENNESSLGINLVKFEYTEADFPEIKNLRHANVSRTGFTISWEGEAENYAVLIKKQTEEKYDTTYTEKTEYAFTELEEGTVYNLRVFGYYGADHTLPGPVAEHTVKTSTAPYCGTPTELVSEYDPESNSALLSWTPGENNNSTTTVYYRMADVQKYDSAVAPNTSHKLENLKTDAVYYWCVQARCNTYLSERSQEVEIKTVANDMQDYARDLAIRVNGRQIVVENPAHRYIKALNVYSTTGVLLKTYVVNTYGNVFIPTGLNQGFVIIEAVGATEERAAVKAVIM